MGQTTAAASDVMEAAALSPQAVARALASIMKTLKPTLQLLKPQRKVLDAKAGATQRIRGSKWLSIRQQVLLRDNYTCVMCGLVSMANECDHIIPLEQGGSNSMHNLQTLCAWVDEHGVKRGCHAAKTASEQRARRGG